MCFVALLYIHTLMWNEYEVIRCLSSLFFSLVLKIWPICFSKINHNGKKIYAITIARATYYVSYIILYKHMYAYVGCWKKEINSLHFLTKIPQFSAPGHNIKHLVCKQTLYMSLTQLFWAYTKTYFVCEYQLLPRGGTTNFF